MGLAGTITLDEDVERGIVWFISQFGGRVAAEVMEEEIIKGLYRRFAAWKVCSALQKLHKQGVAVPVSRVHGGYVRRFWLINPASWSRIESCELSGV